MGYNAIEHSAKREKEIFMLATFKATINPMLMLFVCIAAGFILRRCNIFSKDSGKIMAKMVTWVFAPAISFSTMARYCTVETIGNHATNILLSAFGVALALTLATVLSRVFVRNKCPERGVYAYALAFGNSGYVGDPVVLELFGEEVLAYYKLFCLPLSIAIYTWGISMLVPDGEKKGGMWKKIINAPTVAMFLGIIVGLTGLGQHLPTFLNNSLDSLKVCMGPTAMLLAGVTVANYSITAMLKKAKVYVATALRLAVLPAVIIGALFAIKTLANHLFDLSINNNALHYSFFAVAAPLGLNTVVFPEAFGGNPDTGASMTLISHTLCVISIPIMYALLIALFGPITL